MCPTYFDVKTVIENEHGSSFLDVGITCDKESFFLPLLVNYRERAGSDNDMYGRIQTRIDIVQGRSLNLYGMGVPPYKKLLISDPLSRLKQTRLTVTIGEWI